MSVVLISISVTYAFLCLAYRYGVRRICDPLWQSLFTMLLPAMKAGVMGGFQKIIGAAYEYDVIDSMQHGRPIIIFGGYGLKYSFHVPS